MTVPAVKNVGRLKWVPKKWKPVYEQMILLSVMGRKNVELAKSFGYSTVQVSNILNSPQAKAVKSALTEKFLSEVQDKIPARLQATAIIAASRMQEVFNDDQVWRDSPLAAVDKTLKLLAQLGHTKPAESSTVPGGGMAVTTKNAIFLTPEVGERLTEALRISDGPLEEVPREIEGEYKVLDET